MTDVISQHVPADSLATIRALRPTMPHVPRSIVEAVVSQGGSIGSTTTVARRYGLPNRFRLARMLKRAGLPPLHRLAEWVLVESWLRRSEREGVSLCHIAFHSGRYPSTCYRLVKELTGLKWGELRARGLRWFRSEFARQLQSANLRDHGL
jgi:hypothetical protein